MREGTLVVIVSRAANLFNSRNVSKQNPFCVVRIQNLSHKTETIHRGGQNPGWDHEARFQLNEDLDSRFLKISVFDQNGKKVDLIGDCTVELAPVYSASRDDGFDSWHKISYGGKTTGEVYLEMTWYPAKSRRRQSRSSIGGTSSMMSSQRQNLSPSASMSSLSSVGSLGSRRPLPALPNQISASSPCLPSRSPSPLRHSHNSLRHSQGSSEMDANTSLPSLLNNSQGSRIARHDVDLANTSMPDLRPSPYRSRPMSSSRSTNNLHANLSARPKPSSSVNSLHERHQQLYNPYQTSGHEDEEDLGDSDLDIPEPPQHSFSANCSLNFDLNSSGFDFDPPEEIQEPKEKKNVSHINAWYGKAMFQRFRK